MSRFENIPIVLCSPATQLAHLRTAAERRLTVFEGVINIAIEILNRNVAPVPWNRELVRRAGSDSLHRVRRYPTPQDRVSFVASSARSTARLTSQFQRKCVQATGVA